MFVIRGFQREGMYILILIITTYAGILATAPNKVPVVIDGYPPDNYVVPVNFPYRLPCPHSPSGEATVQWYKDDILLNLEEGNFRLLPDGALYIRIFHPNDAGEYNCKVINLYGAAKSRTAALSSKPGSDIPPKIVHHPSDGFPTEGLSYYLKCGYRSAYTSTVSWYRNGTEMLLPTSNSFLSDGNLNFTIFLTSDYGWYYCMVRNRFGSTISGVAILNKSPDGADDTSGLTIVLIISCVLAIGLTPLGVMCIFKRRRWVDCRQKLAQSFQPRTEGFAAAGGDGLVMGEQEVFLSIDISGNIISKPGEDINPEPGSSDIKQSYTDDNMIHPIDNDQDLKKMGETIGKSEGAEVNIKSCKKNVYIYTDTHLSPIVEEDTVLTMEQPLLKKSEKALGKDETSKIRNGLNCKNDYRTLDTHKKIEISGMGQTPSKGPEKDLEKHKVQEIKDKPRLINEYID